LYNISVTEKELPRNLERENRQLLRIAVCSTPWLDVPPKSYGGIEALIYDFLLHYPEEKLNFFLYSVGGTANRPTAERLKGEIGYHFDHELYSQIQNPGASVKEAIHLVNFYKELDKKIEEGEHFDLVHHHLMFMGGVFAFSRGGEIPHLITMHGPIKDNNDIEFLRSIGTEPGIYFSSISDNQREHLGDLPWIGTVHNGVNCEKFKYRQDKQRKRPENRDRSCQKM
jgi:hypothetical protein